MYHTHLYLLYFLKDPVEFTKYCKETKELYIAELSWYPLSPTGHKVLDHPEHFLNIFPDTIGTGMTSEEPAESANKDIKRFQIEHAFQGNAQRRNKDTFHRLMDRSHPSVLAHLVDKKLERRKREPLPKEVQALLKAPEAPKMNSK